MMDRERRTLQIGAAVIVCAVLLRLAGTGYFQSAAEFLRRPEVMSFLMYLETGRIFRSSEEILNQESGETPVQDSEAVMAVLPEYSEEEALGLDIRYNCEYRPDIETLLTKPLEWDLTGDAPTVLILHTHTTESYTKTAEENYTEAGSFRTLDENCNMLSLGAYLAALLDEGGVGVIQDRTFHDYPSYSGSYAAARETIEYYLAQYPSIQMVLDLHRDAAEDETGNQIATVTQVDGKDTAQLMLVMGSDAGGLDYPNWQENLSLGLKLQAQLERTAPGICRSMNFCGQRYNQDLSTGALLIEVGAAGNTRQEAVAAVEILAKSILSLARGTA